MITDRNVAISMAHQINSGFWQVNGCYFFNKAECLKFASRIRKFDVTFHFFDEVYTTLDWSKEPTDSLEKLYAERALQIREKYEHVALLFSGGCDSTNMLHTFLKNNIKLDEVIAYYPTQVIDRFKSNFNKSDTSPENAMYEYLDSVVPAFDWLKIHHPDIKLTVIDTSEETINVVKEEKIHKIMLSGLTVHPQHSGLYLVYDHLRKNKKKSVAVAGIDKPRILYEPATKKIGSYFFDFVTIQGHWPKETFNGDEPACEYFYFSTDLPALYQKQCFALKKYLNGLHATNDPLLYQVLEPSPKKDDKRILNVQHDAIKKVLYSTWDTRIFQAGKINSYFYNENASWFWSSDLVDQRCRDYYTGQLNELLQGVNTHFLDFDDQNRPSKFKNMFSRAIFF